MGRRSPAPGGRRNQSTPRPVRAHPRRRTGPGGGARMIRGRTTVMAGALLALAALAAPLGWAWAQVTIEAQPRESAPPSIVVTPPPASTTVPGTISVPGTVTVPQ